MAFEHRTSSTTMHYSQDSVNAIQHGSRTLAPTEQQSYRLLNIEHGEVENVLYVADKKPCTLLKRSLVTA
eukprot:5613262-Amphidinium_carterae.1